MDVLDDLQAALDGRYEIVREIGRGGMAVVYLARDIKHDRQVAIKVLPPEMVTGVLAERFLREIRTAAQLTHPNILPLHDSIAVDRVRCYVMPFVPGESLRQRLERERQLGIEQAVDIARQVAAGLDYAHAHGIVHRDIKPENILLVGDQAVIADFGLARAVFSASSAPFTQSGIAVGTPAYMSPEQAAAADRVDGRADLYSLACVFFEMVSGMPPFRGATPGAVIAAHATRTPPSLCAERESCPPSMDAAVKRALAKVPADRFHTAGEFIHALEGWRTSGSNALLPAFAPRTGRRWASIAVIAAVVVLGIALAAPRIAARMSLSGVPLDSNCVAILRFAGEGGRKVTATFARQQMTSALGAWQDLRVVDAPMDASADRTTDPKEGGRAARRLGAARFLMATASPVGDSVELRASLYEANGEPVRQQSVRVADDTHAGEERYRRLAASLLRVSDGEDPSDDLVPGTTRVAAWRAFTRGDSARRAWSLATAENEFRRAVTLDPSFARAHLWLAQLIQWQRRGNTREWGEEAGRAMATSSSLSRHDSMLVAGLTALAGERFTDACATYRAMHETRPDDVLPWLGLGYCLGMDPVVVRSRTSASGWSFRSNVFAAAAAFDSAIAHADGAPPFAYEMLGLLLIAEPLRTRKGNTLAPRSMAFYAIPSLLDDTLVSIPYPAAAVEQGTRPTLPTRGAALQRNIQHLDATYREWVRRAPRSEDAWMALGGIQELEGQPSALTTFLTSRTLTTVPDKQLSLAIAVVRLLVKHERFAEAKAMSDSLLRANTRAQGPQARALAGVAALIGDIRRSADLLYRATQADGQIVFMSRYPVPPPLSEAASEFLVLASAGACNDSLGAFVTKLDRLLVQYTPEDQRAELRRATVVRPVSLAVQCLGVPAVVGMPGTDRLVRMQQFLAAGNQRAVRAAFDTLRTVRIGMRPGDIALDHTFQEGWLLLQLGDTSAAIRYLDLPLTALPTLDPHLLEQVPAAAAVARALALRAQLAAAVGDAPTARRYASEVVMLWRGASTQLQPLVRQMRTLESGEGITRTLDSRTSRAVPAASP